MNIGVVATCNSGKYAVHKGIARIAWQFPLVTCLEWEKDGKECRLGLYHNHSSSMCLSSGVDQSTQSQTACALDPLCSRHSVQSSAKGTGNAPSCDT